MLRHEWRDVVQGPGEPANLPAAVHRRRERGSPVRNDEREADRQPDLRRQRKQREPSKQGFAVYRDAGNRQAPHPQRRQRPRGRDDRRIRRGGNLAHLASARLAGNLKVFCARLCFVQGAWLERPFAQLVPGGAR